MTHVYNSRFERLAGERRVGDRPSVGLSPAKRAMDLTLASALLVFLLPVLLLTALIIRLDSPGPALFGQKRTGQGGKTIRVWKFRTMKTVEPDELVRAARPGDERITHIGRWLRRTSLDELPQLVNVLRGEMSLVGPRPHPLTHDAYYAGCIAGYGQRFRARPGITGLAQASGLRGEVATRDRMIDRVAADNLYIETWSLALDVKILSRTLWTGLVSPDGA